jgi:hypothetical protein
MLHPIGLHHVSATYGRRIERAMEFYAAEHDVLWHETDSHQHGPDQALIVIHLVIVHLDICLLIPQAERIELKEWFAKPCRNDDLEQSARSQNTVTLTHNVLGIPEMLKSIDDGNIVKGTIVKWKNGFNLMLMKNKTE